MLSVGFKLQNNAPQSTTVQLLKMIPMFEGLYFTHQKSRVDEVPLSQCTKNPLIAIII